GAGKTATVTGLTLTGAAAGNYTLSSTTATATADIVPAIVTPIVAVAGKPYDGTTSATLASCTALGAVGGDQVICSGAVSFDSASAGAEKVVTVSGLSLTGASAGNYALASSSTTTTATIAAVTVTPTVTAANKLYDGTTNAALSGCTLTGLING